MRLTVLICALYAPGVFAAAAAQVTLLALLMNLTERAAGDGDSPIASRHTID
jgi:hypothetical protein